MTFAPPVLAAPAPSAAEAPELLDLLLAMLDEVDHPMLLVSTGLRLLHANRAALRRLRAGDTLHVERGVLRAAGDRDTASLASAVQGAGARGLRRQVRLGDTPGAAPLAVLPLAPGGEVALLILAKSDAVEPLTLQCFAQTHGLTGAESKVLAALCWGASPQDIARDQGVAMTTVRTHIASLRGKTAVGSIGQLVRRVTMLPPMVSSLTAGLTWRPPVTG
ncbi:MAG: LuxR C-terminal-related transcriptional regulator [Rhizobacter sp.]